MFGRLISTVFQTLQRPIALMPVRAYNVPSTKLSIFEHMTLREPEIPYKYTKPTPYEIAGSRYGAHPFIHQVRNNWPRPKETKRVKTHGYAKRMSTLSGRKILMRRILKGCSVLSH